jgi:hypothetical protein
LNLADIVLATSPVADAFEFLGISYYIGGSVASSIHGIARATLDIDLVASLKASHIRPLVQWLTQGYYIDEAMLRDALQRQSCFNLVHLETMLKLDVYVLGDRPFDQESFGRRRLDTLEDEEGSRCFYVGSPEDILLHKLEWFRLGGEVSERQWGDVQGVLKVQAKLLDREYLERWAKEVGIADLLQRALIEATR